jgi:hypothetical protein
MTLCALLVTEGLLIRRNMLKISVRLAIRKLKRGLRDQEGFMEDQVL